MISTQSPTNNSIDSTTSVSTEPTNTSHDQSITCTDECCNQQCDDDKELDEFDKEHLKSIRDYHNSQFKRNGNHAINQDKLYHRKLLNSKSNKYS